MAERPLREQIMECLLLLQDATVKFGLGELSASTYAGVRSRLESEIARLESMVLDRER